ncbi:hypothetical protein DPMN_184284 [Dreissena polymorpha]|uniref:Uncharacterized protein n=1 Tax=Dreissena polymorpha TaxID=45954 RepID=A0A9D4I4E9_DREPO|nr:hypothetical protein DPMN_184284 [Dreissena polymorpha]
MPRDSDECRISVICCLPDEQILVADLNNKKVKLLDQQYQMVSHCSVTTKPWDMCQITPRPVFTNNSLAILRLENKENS